MSAKFYIKTYNSISLYKHIIWPFVLIISIGGLFFPMIGLVMYPMFLTIMIIGFWAGRFWCGNLCPRGAFFDLPIRKIGKFNRINSFFRNFWVRIIVLTILMSMFFKNIVLAIFSYGTPLFLDKLGMAGVMMCIITNSIGLSLAFTVNPRTWCTFCPMGSIQKFLYTIKSNLFRTRAFNPKVTLTKSEECIKCGKCSRVCPMQISIHSQDKNQVTSLDCIKCGTCISNCCKELLSFTTEEARSIPHRKQYDAVIHSIKDLNHETKEFTFNLYNALTFKPGQFITILADKENSLFRAYSISKPNEDPKFITITVKLDHQGYATHKIFSLKQEEKVIIEGPMGKFGMTNNGKEKVFIAGGIGITPYLNLVKEYLDNNIKVNLIHGAKNIDDLLYEDYFIDLESRNPNFKYTRTLENSNRNWDGKKGFVTQYMLDIDNKKEAFLCGPTPMINASIKTLKNNGLNINNIYIDSFCS